MAPSGGNRQPTTTCYVTVLFSLLLFLVPSRRLCVTGQWDCPNSDGFYSCWYVDGRYEIVGGLDGAVDSYQAIPPIDMASVASSSTTGTLYRSYTLSSGITVANVQTSAFSEFRVSELLLDGHGIKTLDPLAFSGIGSELSQLILDNNTISQLPVSIFSSLSSVELISLSSNKLVSLESGIFDARLSSKLRWLRLSDNQLSSILDGTFGNLTSLMGLWLDGNQLTSVSSGLLRGLVSLTWLDLSGNSITSISSTAFTDMSSVERLRLQDNRLVQLDAGLIASNPSLELFDVSNNLLTTLPVNDLQYWNTSRFVYLGLSGENFIKFSVLLRI
jgi:Leucine-rich repeat (LRR) protein